MKLTHGNGSDEVVSTNTKFFVKKCSDNKQITQFAWSMKTLVIINLYPENSPILKFVINEYFKNQNNHSSKNMISQETTL